MQYQVNGFNVNCLGAAFSNYIFAEVVDLDTYKIKDIWTTHNVLPGSIIDVGAHVGFFSVFCKSLWPESQVYSFEPCPDNYRLLKENLSQFDLASPINCAVADFCGSANLVINDYSYNSGGNTVIETARLDADHERSLNKPVVDVETTSLSKLFESESIEECSILKLDCEGSEYSIIDDLYENDLLKKVRWIRGEYHLSEALTPDDLNTMLWKISKTHEFTTYPTGVIKLSFPSGEQNASGIFMAYRR